MISDPMPKDPLGVKLCQIFSYAWMSLEGDTDNVAAPNWRTIKNYPLRRRSLWKKFCDAASLVGTRFDKNTEHALIDIDAGSKFRNIEGIQAVRDALETIGIVRTILCRSSWSEGLHLYIPLPERVQTFDLACTIRYTLEAQEMHLEPGQLEVFPNTKAFSPNSRLGVFSEYNGHRLPLQPGSGSAMLDDDLNATTADLTRFFQAWDFSTRAQDMETLTGALKTGRDRHRKRPKQRTHPVDTWRAEWELDINEGWTGSNQTNGLLRVISGYGRVFLRLEGEELTDFVVETAINLPGFEEHCSHQYDIGRKAAAWSRAAERYYWPLGGEPKRDKAAFDINAERALDAQTRIKSAYEWLKRRGQWPQTIRAQLQALSQTAKASFKTIYKYSHLWKPSERCVTPQPASDTADTDPPLAEPCDRSQPPPGGVLHTSSQITKGVPLTDALKSVIPKEWDGGPGEGKGFPQAGGST